MPLNALKFIPARLNALRFSLPRLNALRYRPLVGLYCIKLGLGAGGHLARHIPQTPQQALFTPYGTQGSADKTDGWGIVL